MPPDSRLISDTEKLAAFCAGCAGHDYIAIDTEFIRETTYFPRLCLVQIAAGDSHAAIDPLANGIDLAPLIDLLDNENVIKVFHAGRQDLEIFFDLMQRLPVPVYDTQIAAMVCGYGEQVGYDRLIKGVLDITIDKASRFTDWAQRPLSDAQLRYALDDVIHLNAAYPALRKQIADAGRDGWVAEEIVLLTDLSLYDIDPMDAWLKVKKPNNKPAALNRLRHLAAWRETEARKRDLPRGRLIKDETLIALADSNPKSVETLGRVRGFPGGAAGKLAKPVLGVLAEANKMPKEKWPELKRGKTLKPPEASADLLRVLLKHCAEQAGVAPRLIASAGELDRIALGMRDDSIRALGGWRGEIFGRHAIALANGEITLGADGNRVQLHKVR